VYDFKSNQILHKILTSIFISSENTEAISYMITYGFAAVISTRVSNELGARNVAKAKKALAVSLALSLLLGRRSSCSWALATSSG